MTDEQWRAELDAAITESKAPWRVVLSECGPDGSCRADLAQPEMQASGEVRLSLTTFVDVESRRAEIIRQIHTHSQRRSIL